MPSKCHLLNAIYKKVPQERWDHVVREVTGHLSRGARDKKALVAAKVRLCADAKSL
jgi:uncharacterized membrane protein